MCVFTQRVSIWGFEITGNLPFHIDRLLINYIVGVGVSLTAGEAVRVLSIDKQS